jgi:hypothetical protein
LDDANIEFSKELTYTKWNLDVYKLIGSNIKKGTTAQIHNMRIPLKIGSPAKLIRLPAINHADIIC